MKRSAAFLSLLLLAASFAWAQAAPGDVRYTQPGRLVAAGDTQLNFYCLGSGSPTVVFDAGWEDWSPAWATIQPEIARHLRACAYDRAGSGFSAPGPMPRTSVEIAKELHAALRNAGIPGPYLLVGHSFGSYDVRTFADLYLPEVYGIVLVDGESGDLLSPAARAAGDRSDAKNAAALQACGEAVAQHRPLPEIPMSGHSYAPAPHTPCSHQFFRGLPMPE